MKKEAHMKSRQAALIHFLDGSVKGQILVPQNSTLFSIFPLILKSQLILMQYSVKRFTCNNSYNCLKKKDRIIAHDFYKNTYKGYPSFE